LPYDSEIPPNFRIPTMWRPQIMEVISKRSLPTPPVRSAMIRDLVVHMFSFGKRPSRSFCKAVARQLISTYPFLKDSIGSGYVSLFVFYAYALTFNVFSLYIYYACWMVWVTC
jgi:hypothetical protein